MLSFVPNDHNMLGVYPGKTITSHVGNIWMFSLFNWEIQYILIHGPRSSYKKSWVLQECLISPQRLISKPDLWGPKFGKTCPYINLQRAVWCGGKGESPPKNRRFFWVRNSEISYHPNEVGKHQNLQRSPCSPNGVGQFLLVGGSSHIFLPGKKKSQTTLSLKMLTKWHVQNSLLATRLCLDTQ